MNSVCAINREERLVLLDSGQVIPITTFIDCDGDETEWPDGASACVAGPDEGGLWYTVDLSAFEQVRVN